MPTRPPAALESHFSTTWDGQVVAVRGAIIDVRFDGDPLPALALQTTPACGARVQARGGPIERRACRLIAYA